MRKYIFTSILMLGCLIGSAAVHPASAAAEENESPASPVHVCVHDPPILEDKDGSWDHTYAPNAIDPNLLFDASGEKFYMSYGSWSGGLKTILQRM